MNKYTLIIGPAPKTRGGITAVIKAYQNSTLWNNWNCIWIHTFIDKTPIHKILIFLGGIMKFFIFLPKSKIIHIHFSEPTSALRKNFFLNTAIFFRKKTILHFHSFSPKTTIYGPQKALYNKMFSKADLIIALSSYWKEHINNLVHEANKIQILYNPCPKTHKDLGLEKQKIILFAGTLNERKGYKDLISAFSFIAEKFPDWKIVFAGNGDIEKGKEMADKLGVISQTDFRGWVSGNDKELLFNNSAIFCLPSYAEGFPMAVLDAWAYGLPVITTPVGGLPDILKHGENALIFEPGDIECLSKNLEELINNKALRKKLSEGSLKLSEYEFNITNITKQLDSIYSGLLLTQSN